jgi:transmembrane sensor
MSHGASNLSDLARDTAAAWCIRLSEGPLDKAERAQFEDWLHADAEHPPLFERTVTAWGAIEDQASQPAMIMMRTSAVASAAQARSRGWPGSRYGRLIGAIAACFLVMLSVGLWWHYTPTTYETGYGERRLVALEDGSTISLDAATRVDVSYEEDRRELWLKQGRAKFTVAKNPLRPFSVQAGQRIVVATGTQFSIENLAGQVRVILYEGHVAIMNSQMPVKSAAIPIAGTKDAAEKALLPGEQLVLQSSSPVGRIVPVDFGNSLEWEAGLLQFSDEPLSVAVERMNRYGSTKMVVPNPEDAAILISGQFAGGDVDAFVEGISAVFPLEAKHGSDGRIILTGIKGRHGQ